MKDNFFEKTFLYLINPSVLFHLAVFGLLVLLLPEKAKTVPEPTMVDLTDLPEPPPLPPGPRPVTKRAAEKPQRVTRETAPKGSRETERIRQPAESANQQRQTEIPPVQSVSPSRDVRPNHVPQVGEDPITRGEGLFRPRTGATPERSALFPSVGNMARREES